MCVSIPRVYLQKGYLSFTELLLFFSDHHTVLYIAFSSLDIWLLALLPSFSVTTVSRLYLTLLRTDMHAADDRLTIAHPRPGIIPSKHRRTHR